MDEANEFVAVQQHPRAPGLSAQHVFNVVLEWIIIILKRDEFVSVRVSEYAQ